MQRAESLAVRQSVLVRVPPQPVGSSPASRRIG